MIGTNSIFGILTHKTKQNMTAETQLALNILNIEDGEAFKYATTILINKVKLYASLISH